MTTSETPAQLAQRLAEALEIEPLALSEEYIRLPADLSYWNEQYAQALRAHLFAKIETDRIEAEAYNLMRASLEQGGKVTEKMVDSAVSTHPDVIRAREAEAEAEVARTRARGVCDALSAKREMLVSLGAHVRIEMQHDPVIREQQAAVALTRR